MFGTPGILGAKDLKCLFKISVTVQRSEVSHHAENWGVSDTCKHVICGFRSGSTSHSTEGTNRIELADIEF